MTKNNIFDFLKSLADSAECYLREAKNGMYIICWKSFKVGEDGKVGNVFININPSEEATKALLKTRFCNALNTLIKNEPKAI